MLRSSVPEPESKIAVITGAGRGIGQALALGFGHVEAGVFVRSSYHADEQVPAERRLAV